MSLLPERILGSLKEKQRHTETRNPPTPNNKGAEKEALKEIMYQNPIRNKRILYEPNLWSLALSFLVTRAKRQT